MKDLNPFKIVFKVQGANSILRMGFFLSKYPHFNSAYLVKVRFSLDLAVHTHRTHIIGKRLKGQDSIADIRKVL